MYHAVCVQKAFAATLGSPLALWGAPRNGQSMAEELTEEMNKA
jgi:hypothetical protein